MIHFIVFRSLRWGGTGDGGKGRKAMRNIVLFFIGLKIHINKSKVERAGCKNCVANKKKSPDEKQIKIILKKRNQIAFKN